MHYEGLTYDTDTDTASEGEGVETMDKEDSDDETVHDIEDIYFNESDIHREFEDEVQCNN